MVSHSEELVDSQFDSHWMWIYLATEVTYCLFSCICECQGIRSNGTNWSNSGLVSLQGDGSPAHDFGIQLYKIRKLQVQLFLFCFAVYQQQWVFLSMPFFCWSCTIEDQIKSWRFLMKRMEQSIAIQNICHFFFFFLKS